MLAAEGCTLRDLPEGELALVLRTSGRRFEREVPAGANSLRVEVDAWQACTLAVEGAAPLAANERRRVVLRDLDREPEAPLQKSLVGARDEEVRFELVFVGRYEASVQALGLPVLPSGEPKVLAGPVLLEVKPDVAARLVLRL